jgi:crotonobetainyl-CoA:carnitine CoA-transferase CaiB-like acyl-CoA transferase
VDFGGEPCEQRSAAPEQGQHSEEILAELGHDSDAIAKLRERGVVG